VPILGPEGPRQGDTYLRSAGAPLTGVEFSIGDPSSAASLRQMNGPAPWPGVSTCLASAHSELVLRRVASANWANPERVQPLLTDDGDAKFWLYMFLHGELRNVAPALDGGATAVSGRAR
jgi:hypothetical protein